MNINTVTYTVTHTSLSALWRGFIAAAAAFGADLPTALHPDALEGQTPEDAFGVVLTEIASAAEGRHVHEDEIVPAGFEIEISPGWLGVKFGSGRSAALLRVSRYGESCLEIGVQYPADEMLDPDSAVASAQRRYDAAVAAMVGASFATTAR